MAKDFKKGDTVWAKMKGYPYWPGIITDPLKEMKTPSKDNFRCVYFFGTKNYSWIDITNLKDYASNKLEFGNSGKTSLKLAVDDIEEFLKRGDSKLFTKIDPFDQLVSVSKTPKRGIKRKSSAVSDGNEGLPITKKIKKEVKEINKKETKEPKKKAQGNIIEKKKEAVQLKKNKERKEIKKKETNDVKKEEVKEVTKKKDETKLVKKEEIKGVKKKKEDTKDVKEKRNTKEKKKKGAKIVKKKKQNKEKSEKQIKEKLIKEAKGKDRKEAKGKLRREAKRKEKKETTEKDKKEAKEKIRIEAKEKDKKITKGKEKKETKEKKKNETNEMKIRKKSTKIKGKKGTKRTKSKKDKKDVKKKKQRMAILKKILKRKKIKLSPSKLAFIKKEYKKRSMARKSVSPLPDVDFRSTPKSSYFSRRSIAKVEVEPIELSKCSEDLIKKKIKPSSLIFGFIGLGVKGSRILKNIVHSKHSVIIWNRTPKKCEQFENIGVQAAETPYEVASAANITFLCVGNNDINIVDVLFGSDLSLAIKSGGKSFVNLSHISDDTSAHITDFMEAFQCRYLELRTLGTIQEADKGLLRVFAAGDLSLFNECESCINAFSGCYNYVGMSLNELNGFYFMENLMNAFISKSLTQSLRLVKRSGNSVSQFFGSLLTADYLDEEFVTKYMSDAKEGVSLDPTKDPEWLQIFKRSVSLNDRRNRLISLAYLNLCF